MPNVLSPMDLVSRPDNMDEIVLRTSVIIKPDQCLCFPYINEPRRETTGFLHMRKQSHRSFLR